MTPFTVHTGVAAPILRVNIDTDAIIPSREMKTVSKAGLADGLFAGWRYDKPGSRTPNPDFVLNHPDFAETTVLLAGENFGCGSSREHAVWALDEYGIRCVIAPTFGAIFYNNCIKNGILPIELPDETIRTLAEQVMTGPQEKQLRIDLEDKTVTAPDGEVLTFEIADTHREMLLEGLDSIDMTLKLLPDIEAFEAADPRAVWARAE
ncbi:MAG: 3-isopropylmalate dehydratase small subunit [Sphingomonadales bacterium]